jgi:hypothetical protein
MTLRQKQPYLAATVVFGMLSAGVVHAAQPSPVVVELFQSQGCSSCPPAAANVNALADHPNVLALSFGVTYWDDLGWKDTFATPQYTARQWAYAHGLHHGNVGTPEVVLNGRTDLIGNDAKALDKAIMAAARPPTATLAVDRTKVTVAGGLALARPADVWLVRYDPRVQLIPIQRGENGGKTLPHRNVVRQLVRLGSWSGKEARFALPEPSSPELLTAVLVQLPDGGAILGAAKG